MAPVPSQPAHPPPTKGRVKKACPHRTHRLQETFLTPGLPSGVHCVSSTAFRKYSVKSHLSKPSSHIVKDEVESLEAMAYWLSRGLRGGGREQRGNLEERNMARSHEIPRNRKIKVPVQPKGNAVHFQPSIPWAKVPT